MEALDLNVNMVLLLYPAEVCGFAGVIVFGLTLKKKAWLKTALLMSVQCESPSMLVLIWLSSAKHLWF